MSVALTAADITDLVRRKRHGPLELQLLDLIGEAKTAARGADTVLRVHFPEVAGGVEIICHRRTGWRARLATWLLRGLEVE